MKDCLICDDHELMREALGATMRGRWPNVEINKASDFNEAWSLAASGPDVCLVDLIMPGADPIDGVRGIFDAAPRSLVIVVTGTDEDRVLLDLLDAGVHGFLQKTSSTEVILAAVDLALAGGRYLPPRVAELAIKRRPVENLIMSIPAITDRQRDVLLLISEGRSNKEIARALDLSPATVKTHVANIISSIGANNRTEAAVKARAIGLI
jgi:DNA-binding NarL/FixJ family response regulator